MTKSKFLQHRFRSLTLAPLALSVAFSAAACGAENHETTASEVGAEAGSPAAKGREEGTSPFPFQVLEQSDARLTIDARKGKAHVRVELVRGEARQPEYLEEPEVDGYFEGDTLVTDANEHAFLAHIGGDLAVDLSWMERLSTPQHGVTAEQRKLDLALAAEVGQLVADAEQFDSEQRRLARDLAEGARLSLHEWNTEGVPVGEPSLSDQALPSETTSPKAAVPTYVHQVFIRRGSVTGTPAFVQHSSVRLKVFNNSGVLTSDISTSNHGRVATDSTLVTATGCPRSWSGRSNALPPFQPYKTTDLVNMGGNAGGCSTSYGLTSGKHVCNDDTVAEYSNVKFNQAMAWGTCNDTALRYTAPSCN